jgi:hypothetical protein
MSRGRKKDLDIGNEDDDILETENIAAVMERIVKCI